MCGVAGAVGQRDGVEITKVMLDALRHRGPDADALVDLSDERTSVQLAHSRLSIIDLSAAADQPFRRGPFTLAYNGELYNYQELRRDLAARGETFRTTSDTEVLLAAWATWGTKALSRFRGMFAFAVHDATTGQVTLARDPLGIKPLYVLRRGGGIVFASELQAIVAGVGPELTVDPRGMIASALYYWIPDNRCAVHDVHKVAPGSYEQYALDGTVSTGTYWSATSRWRRF